MLKNYDEVVRRHRVWVLEDGSAIVAASVLIVEPERALLDAVAVLPQFQGRGLGRQLIAHAEAEAKRLGYKAIELYARLGYREFVRKTEKGYNRVYMRKPLHDPE